MNKYERSRTSKVFKELDALSNISSFDIDVEDSCFISIYTKKPFITSNEIKQVLQIFGVKDYEISSPIKKPGLKIVVHLDEKLA